MNLWACGLGDAMIPYYYYQTNANRNPQWTKPMLSEMDYSKAVGLHDWSIGYSKWGQCSAPLSGGAFLAFSNFIDKQWHT